jgi:integron integrase
MARNRISCFGQILPTSFRMDYRTLRRILPGSILPHSRQESAMDPAEPRRSRLPAEIWGRFTTIVHQRGAREPADRWYVIRAEQFERALQEKDLRACDATDVNAYLRELGEQAQLQDWQYRQVVEALEILLAHALELPWAARFDWGFWRDSARRLESRHPTIARQPAPEEERALQSASGTTQAALLEAVAIEIRRRAYSVRTEQTYLQWIRRFIAFCGGRNPRELGAAEVKAFLEHLAVRRNVAANTQNQALSALVFLYRHVIEHSLELDNFVRAKRPRHLPVVLTRQETRTLLEKLHGTQWLMASLLYGSGMRLMEVIRLRVKDVDFEYREILVRNAKGAKDRVVPLPETVIDPLRGHLVRVRELFTEDRERGLPGVHMPGALAKKYPNAGTAWIWQFVFPSGRLSVDPRSGVTRRHHVHENGLQKAVSAAARSAEITKKVNCHSLRHYVPLLTMSSSAELFQVRPKASRRTTRHSFLEATGC